MLKLLKRWVLAVLAVALMSGGCAQADSAPPVTGFAPGDFDPARHIDVHEIERGMHGYGLTVFQGFEPEPFDVEVVGIMRRFEADRQAILVRVVGNEVFERAAGVQGVSGSPVYIDGRLAGAMAFGWAYGDEPLYGVTPIRDMLEVRQASRVRGEPMAARKGLRWEPVVYQDMLRWPLLDSDQRAAMVAAAGLGSRQTGDGLTTLPLGLLVLGLSDAAADAARAALPGLNLASMDLAGGGSGTAAAGPAELKAGSTVTIPLVRGDMSGSVSGTVTDVVGNQVYAFGHGWNSEGAARWPMATGRVHTFVSRLDMSFKLSEAGPIVGAILADEAKGIYGELGAEVVMVPARVVVRHPDTGFEQVTEVEIAEDELANPTLATLAVLRSIMRRGDLPREHTLRYRFEMTFDGMAPLTFANVSSGRGVYDILPDVLETLSMVLSNPWRQLRLTGLDGEVVVEQNNIQAAVESIALGRRIYRPGETVTARFTLAPQRGRQVIRAVSLRLPDNLPPGKYRLRAGSWHLYTQLLQEAQPARWSAFDVDGLQEVFQRRLNMQRDRLYIGLALPREGLAIEDDELPQLPESRRALLADASRRQTVTPLFNVISNDAPTGYAVMGGDTIEIEVVAR